MSDIYFSLTEKRSAFVWKVLDRHREEIAASTKILVKPNCVSGEGYPTTTHPDLLDAVLGYLGSMGKATVVGDGPAFDARPHRVIKQTPLRAVCEAHGLELVDFLKAKKKSLRLEQDANMRLRLCAVPFECDYVISLPVLKVHALKRIGLSSALKNQFGYLPSLERLRWHIRFRRINRVIAAINALRRTDLFIVDAVEVLLAGNELRHGGTKRKAGVLYAGKDPLALDSYGLTLLQGLGEPSLMGKKAGDIESLRLAGEYGLGSTDFNLIPVSV